VKTLAVAILCLLGGIACAGFDPANGGVSTSLVLERTKFLSTEKAEATLTIVNKTTAPVFFSKCGLTFFIRTASGWSQRPNCTSITHIISPDRIEPSAQFVTQIELPKCDVHSDPCTEDVRAKYPVFIRKNPQWYTSSLPRYEFVPDPSATYDIPGLSGNRPLFIVPGVARDTVFPDTMALEFTASPSEAHPPFTHAPALVSELATTLSQAGVSVGGSGFETDADTWKARFFVDNASNQRAAIGAALETVRARYSTRISTITHYFVFNPFPGAQNITDAAFSQAKRQAQELAEITGAQNATPATWGRSLPRLFLGAPDPNWQFPDLNRALPYDKPAVLNQTAATATSVTIVTEALFAGAEPARFDQPASILQSAAQAFRPPDSWFLPPLDPQAIVAADRPELYITGTASAQAALARGFAPYFAAALHARARSSYLAGILGVHPENASLFAIYPMSQDADLRTVGIATTFAGGEARHWKSIKPDPQVRAYRSDDSRQRAMVPIDVPDSSTTIVEMAGASPPSPPGGDSSNCAALETRLLKATIRQNWMQAQSDALRTQRTIRKLLLVAVFPMDSQGACTLNSMMIFRTK
jgi:hypothetical protein